MRAAMGVVTWVRERPGHSRVDLLPEPVKFAVLALVVVAGGLAYWASGGALVPTLALFALMVAALFTVVWVIAPRRPLTVIEEADRDVEEGPRL